MAVLKMLALSVAAVVSVSFATPPPGHVKEPDTDENPPKYEFGYDVQDGKGGRQGHIEARDGIYARGVYYANLPDGFTQKVEYYVDDWGYHPVVSYTRTEEQGRSTAGAGDGTVQAASIAKEAAVLHGQASAAQPVAALVGPPGGYSVAQSATPVQQVAVSTVRTPVPVYSAQDAAAATGGLYQQGIGTAVYQAPAQLLPQSSSKLVGGQEHALFFKIPDSSQVAETANQIQGSSGNRAFYATFVNHDSGYQQGASAAALTGGPNLVAASNSASQSSSYRDINSQSSGGSSVVAGVTSGHQALGSQSASSSGGYESSTVAPVASNLVILQPQVSYQDNYGATGTSNVYKASASPVVSTLVVQQPPASYEISYQEDAVSNSHNEAFGSASVSSTPSALTAVRQPQASYQGSYETDAASNSYNEISGSVVSSTPSVLTVENQPRVVYQQHIQLSHGGNYGASDASNVLNQVSGSVSLSTLSPQAIVRQTQLAYEESFGGSVASSSYNDESGSTASSTPTTITIEQQPQVSYQESYAENSASNSYNQISGSTVTSTPSTLFKVVKKPEVVYEENFEVSSSGSNYNEGTNLNAASSTSNAVAQQSNIVYEDIYKNLGTSGFQSGGSTAAPNAVVHQPQASYQASRARPTGGNVYRGSSKFIKSSTSDTSASYDYVSESQRDASIGGSSYTSDVNRDRNYGTKIKPGGRDSFVTTVSPPTLTTSSPHRYSQYVTHNHKEEYSASITPPTVARASFRPIVVADFGAYQDLSTVTPKPTILSKYSTPAPSTFVTSTAELSSASADTSYSQNALYSESFRDGSHVTVRPVIVNSNSNGNSVAESNYVVSSTAVPQATVLITPRYELLPVPSGLLASSENAPQISVALPRKSPTFVRKNKQNSHVNKVKPTTNIVPSPAPEVNERPEEHTPKITTIVEVQKSIPIEIPYGVISAQGDVNVVNIPTVPNQIQIHPITQINNELQAQIHNNAEHFEKANQAQIGGTQLLLQTYLEDQQAKEQAKIQEILLAQLQSQTHLIHQQQANHVQIANMQALLQALELENTQAEIQAVNKAQALTELEQKDLKEALNTVLSGTQPLKQSGPQIRVETVKILQPPPQQSNGFSGTRQTDVKASSVSNTLSRNVHKHVNDGIRSNSNYTSKFGQPTAAGESSQNGQFGRHFEKENNDLFRVKEKPNNQDPYAQNENESEYASESINQPLIHYNHNVPGTVRQPRPENAVRYSQPLTELKSDASEAINVNYDRKAANAEQQIRSAYTQYYNDVHQLQTGHNQQLYGSVDLQNYGINQPYGPVHSGAVHQLLEVEKPQGLRYSPQIFGTGSEEQFRPIQPPLESHREPIKEFTKVITVEKPVPIEHMKLVQVEKPVLVPHAVPVEHTKYVEVEKPVPVEVTKLVPVDRPLPYPQPYAVPQPVAVPFVVPHPVQVPVAHVVTVPRYVHVPVKQYHPVYIQGNPPKTQASLHSNVKYKDNLYRSLPKHAPYGIPRYAPYNTRKPFYSVHNPGHTHVYHRVSPRNRHPLGSKHMGNMRIHRMEYGGFRPLIMASKTRVEPAPVREILAKRDS